MRLLMLLLAALAGAQELLDQNVIDLVPGARVLQSETSLRDAIQSPGCLPSSQFKAFTLQLLQQTSCASDGQLLAVSLVSISPLVDASGVEWPFLQRAAVASLLRVVNGSSQVLRVTRALEPLPVHYLNFVRSFLRVCGQPRLVEYVGLTPLERGASLVVEDPSLWANRFIQSGEWQFVDNVFTYVGPDVLDFGQRSVRVFQKLWNSANPWDVIPESGYFDTATRVRLERTPAHGLVGAASLCPSTSVEDALVNQGSLALSIAVPLLLCAALAFLVHFLTRLRGKPGTGIPADLVSQPIVPTYIDPSESVYELASTDAAASSFEEDEGEEESSGLFQSTDE